MVKIERSEYFFEMRTAECSFSQKGCSFDDCLKFRLMRWTDQFETTICNGKKQILLSLTDRTESVEIGVFYFANTEDEKEKIYDVLSNFIEEIDGEEINLFEYIGNNLDTTKFPVIEGIERRWERDIVNEEVK